MKDVVIVAKTTDGGEVVIPRSQISYITTERGKSTDFNDCILHIHTVHGAEIKVTGINPEDALEILCEGYENTDDNWIDFTHGGSFAADGKGGVEQID